MGSALREAMQRLGVETLKAWYLFGKEQVSILCLMQGNVVALVHDNRDAEDKENGILLNGLSHQSHLVLRAEGLATGFCKDVHGQVLGLPVGCFVWKGNLGVLSLESVSRGPAPGGV